MSGHSHWAGIKHKKALIDAKRGKVWSKLSKAIIVAARMGGGDPDANNRLRVAIDAARAVSMPKDNIMRAVKRGTGELEGTTLEEVVYEGYGSGGVAILCDVLTDNRNRTTSELRKAFELHDGKLGSAGCVAWMFDKKGLFFVSADKTTEDALMEVALDAGADDVKLMGDKFEVTCDPAAFQRLADALAKAGIETDAKEITRIPKDSVTLDIDTARKVLKLMERLDDHEDVQNVSANFDIPEQVMAELSKE